MAENKKESSKQDIAKLQMIEQNLQQFLSQKQQFQMQLSELESADNEVKEDSVAYKIIGNIMVKSDPKEIKEDLKSKREMISLRIKTIEKQESKLQEKAKDLQDEVMKNLEG